MKLKYIFFIFIFVVTASFTSCKPDDPEINTWRYNRTNVNFNLGVGDNYYTILDWEHLVDGTPRNDLAAIVDFYGMRKDTITKFPHLIDYPFNTPGTYNIIYTAAKIGKGGKLKIKKVIYNDTIVVK